MGGSQDESAGYAGGHPTNVHNDATGLATAAELARLEKKRSDTRLNIGVTPERMKQWLDEHQQMLRAQQQGNQEHSG
ncbi:hypothetical protein Gpo141_00002155 [Globisporangium polare]